MGFREIRHGGPRVDWEGAAVLRIRHRATSGVFAVVYEVLIRREQTHFVIEALDLRESMIRAGLDEMSSAQFVVKKTPSAPDAVPSHH